MNYRILCIAASAVLLLGSAACSRNKKEALNEKAPSPRPVAEVVPSTESPISQNNTFTFRLWDQVEKKGENLLMSPFSINTAMGMAYTGARGATADEIAKVMAFPLDHDNMHEIFYKSLMQLNSIQDNKRAEFNIANALFNAEANKERLIPDYSDILEKSFGSELFSLDFNQAKESADFINQWVEKHTNSRIKDIVSERQIAQSNDGMVLVNAIYFKSNWLTQFQEANTSMDRFYTTSSRDKHKVMAMMKQTGTFSYGEMPGYQLLEMPYAEPEVAMLFVLPKDIDEASKELNLDLWNKWMDSLSTPRKVEVSIPRFRIEHTLDNMVEDFRQMGIKEAFIGGSADFSGILKMEGKNDLYISDIVHKAFLEVVEKGTEAAAATQIGFAKTSFEPPTTDIPVFTADQPFFCAILHKPTGEILFFGKVVDPEIVE